MANEAVDEFFALLERDNELQTDLQAEVERSASRAIIEVARRRGLEFTSEDLKSRLADQVAELDEEELDAVAGGLSPNITLGAPAVIQAVANVAVSQRTIPTSAVFKHRKL
jgi:predicted ribosomally synthesized peptide with nif11-like leader